MTQTRTAELDELLEFVKEHRGFDFTGYKRPSLERRIGRRMQEVEVDGYDAYREYLEAKPDEFARLFDTILINVTSFFRDPEHWRNLADNVLPELIQARNRAEPFRVWSTGCASGEEAYSVAMLLAEALGPERFISDVKIYATDVDEGALREGRHASYVPKKIENVPEELLGRYFENVNGRFVFRKELRRSVIFGRHDLIQDPPISRVDLLVARNTLMYFSAATQRHILTNFHFALRDYGVLFLGKSEVLLTRSSLFVPISLKHRAFAKVVTNPARDPRPAIAGGPDPGHSSRLGEIEFETGPMAQIVVDGDGVLVMANAQARILFGLARKDLGRPVKDLQAFYRPIELHGPIEEAAAKQHPVHIRNVEWPTGGGEPRFFEVQVTPLYAADGTWAGTAAAFSDVTRFRKLQEGLVENKRELETAYEELQSTAEELETTNEELQSTNEELETTNEELMSTNEELETMNEELQSTNEELETMNDELAQRTDELNETNAFLGSILDNLEAGVAVLNREMQVTAWSPQAQDLWGLRPEEAEGEHFLSLDFGLPVDRLRDHIRAALNGEQTDVVVAATNRLGRAIECKVTCRPLVLPGGEVAGVIVMMEEQHE
jgi:two-component system, chemotaxis family, CheB/CheR fusion protein